MTSQPGKQKIAIQTLSNGQLTEYNMKNIFLEKSCKKCGGETIPRSFSKKSILSLSLDQQSEIFCSLFLLYVQADDYPVY